MIFPQHVKPKCLGSSSHARLAPRSGMTQALGLGNHARSMRFFKKIYRNSLIVVLKTYLFCIFIFVFLTKYIFIFSIFLSSIFGH
jgi:hypothetical protein